ncbi:MAG: alpha/beta hydrolase [Pseudomonadota bacterium]
MKTINAQDGTQLYVKQWGVGRPVIFIHGWPLSADSWDDQALAIAEEGFRVIAYDRRGFGRSEQPWNGYDYNTLADDLAAVIEQTQASDATLVGFSMGGGEVARYLSRHHGHNISQVALISSVVPYLLKTTDNCDGVDSSVFHEMIGGILEDRPHFFADFFNDFFGVGLLSSPVSDEQLEWTRSLAMQASLKATIECIKSFSSTDFREDLAAFSMPTLLIHGTHDKTVPIELTSRKIANAIPHAKLIEYEGAPHGLLVTHKDQISQDLINFIKMH